MSWGDFSVCVKHISVEWILYITSGFCSLPYNEFTFGELKKRIRVISVLEGKKNVEWGVGNMGIRKRF
jgi:hypothetical protein